MLRCLIHIKELYVKNIQHRFTMIERMIMVAFIPDNPLGRDGFVGAASAAIDRTVNGVAIAAESHSHKDNAAIG
jgi:hypothetical protein